MAELMNVVLVGDKEMIAALDGMPERVRVAVTAAVKRQTLALQRHVIADKLSGQVLKVRTGALRRSIQESVGDEGPAVVGKVWSAGDVKYAAIHEFGYHGQENVREHVRHVVFGREVDPFVVPAFTRSMNMPARPFMRTALADRKDAILEDVRKSAIEAARL